LGICGQNSLLSLLSVGLHVGLLSDDDGLHIPHGFKDKHGLRSAQ
jgi:hypothetical protein